MGSASIRNLCSVNITVQLLVGYNIGQGLCQMMYSTNGKDTDNDYEITVGFSVFSAMFVAVSIGSLFPIILNKLNIDPAVSTGSFVTTAIDILGVFIYFFIADSILTL